MFERFSGQARHVVVSAQEEARELDHNYIGTEHLLLGLLTSDSLASASLNALGYTRDDVQAKVVATVGRGKASPGGHIPFTPRAKKVLELSLREALQLKHNYIGTEHILLGLLREGEGMAAQILADKHPLDRIRGEVLTRIESPAPREVHGAGRTPAAHEVLALAAELAGEGPVGSHHILEAILQQPDSAAAKVLGDAGIDLDQLAAKLDQVSIEDTADDTPQQAAARQLELSVTDETVTVVLCDPASLELGKRILQLNGGPLAARGPQLELLGRLWTAVNDWLATTARALAPPPDVAPEVAEKL
ncbi:MAG TPA: Clp protease N-terminal domain-containing protein, partial [Propionibacteriaceae bacterium]|nr:Clp protease N-terminal domain-containing protein [Propionibacteriaceae bacterium]